MNPSTETAIMFSKVVMIPLIKLSISSLNCRKEINEAKLLELAASIKAKGIQNPITVRPVGDMFEIIAGQRRFRAARRCELTEMPAIIKEMDDEQAIEYSLIDNTQREELDPLDEAEEYAKLLKKSKGITIEKISGQTGKPKSYVAKRLKLNSLIETGKKAFKSGKINLGQALLIAPLNEEDQKIILKRIADWNIESEEEVARWIADNIMLSLSAAPWPKKEDFPSKVESVACAVCPKRTGADPDLFGDSKNDRCLDARCYHAKMESFLYKKKEELKLRTEKFVQISTQYNGKGKEVLGRDSYNTPSKGCENAVTGLIVEGENVGHTKRVCVDPGCKVCRPSYSGDNSYRKKEAAERKKTIRELKIRSAIFKAVYETSLKINKTRLEAIGKWVVERLDFDSSKRICDALGIVAPKSYGGRDYRGALQRHYEKNKAKTMLMAIHSDALNTRWNSTEGVTGLLRLAKEQKINTGKIRASFAEKKVSAKKSGKKNKTAKKK